MSTPNPYPHPLDMGPIIEFSAQGIEEIPAEPLAEGRKFVLMVYDDGAASLSEFTVAENGEHTYIGRGFVDAHAAAGMVATLTDPTAAPYWALAGILAANAAARNAASAYAYKFVKDALEAATPTFFESIKRAVTKGCRVSWP